VVGNITAGVYDGLPTLYRHLLSTTRRVARQLSRPAAQVLRDMFPVESLILFILLAEPEAMTPECLQCLCEGASGCKQDLGCDNGVCGPFQITRPYWLDAGKPTVKDDRRGSKNPAAYAECANNMECSGRAVTAYMKRYAQVRELTHNLTD